MMRDAVLKLEAKAKEVAKVFGSLKRENNVKGETWILTGITPLSETLAVATYHKNHSNKLSLCLFYWIMNDWRYFFPRESHVYGMIKLPQYLQRIEEHNFKQNGGCIK